MEVSLRLLLVFVLAASLVGCGSHASMKQPPVDVTGKLSRGGQPLGGVVMVFQPLGDGHMRELPVGADGSFRGAIVSGEYAYYVAQPASQVPGSSIAAVSPEYFQPQMSRTVMVEPGKELAIALD